MTKEQLSLAIREKYMPKIKKCCICGSTDTYIRSDGYEQWYGCVCDKDNCTKYLCLDCWTKYSPNSNNNFKKSRADWRTGNHPSSPVGRGFIGQRIVANTYKVDDCNLKTDNFHFYVDLSKISGYGYSEVKTASLIYGTWVLETRRDQEYDTLFLVCMDSNWPWLCVERIYAIPWEVVVNRGKSAITITKDSPRIRITQHEEYRLDEKPFNDVYQNMKIENCPVLGKKKIVV